MIYKSFVRPHLDYGDVIYDDGSLAITRAIQSSSREKLYQDLGLETLRKRRCLRRLCLFYKIRKNKSPSYLFRLIPTTTRIHITGNSNNLKDINV